MEWIRFVLVLVILIRAIYTDWGKGIIENRCTVPGMVSGLVWATVNGGLQGLFVSMKMILIVLIVLYVLFVIKGLGAGDIKLFCVLAAFYPEKVMGIVVVAFVMAAGMSLVRMVVRYIRKMPVYISGEGIKFSIPIGIATILVDCVGDCETYWHLFTLYNSI